MMKSLKILWVVGLIFCISSASAQELTRQEKRALKKEIKAYKKDPKKWVKLMDDHKKEVSDLEQEVARLKAELEEAKKRNEELIAQIEELNAKYNNLLATMPTNKLPKGTVYQVQMGYYQHLDLVSFNNKLKVVKAEEVDGAKRYVIGYFEDLMDAWQFASDIKQLGIKDAFVTKYTNGVRDMKFDALKAIER